MDSRHLSDVAKAYALYKEDIKQKLWFALKTLENDPKHEAAAAEVSRNLSTSLDSPDSSYAVASLYKAISDLTQMINNDDKILKTTQVQLDALNNILSADLQIDNEIQDEAEKYLQNMSLSSYNTITSSLQQQQQQQQRPARPTKPVPTVTTTTTTKPVMTRDQALGSKEFQNYLKSLPSYQNIQNMIKANPDSERAKSWKAFLSQIENPSSNASWMNNFEHCHHLMEKFFATNEDMPEELKKTIRAQYGDVGQGLGHIVTSTYTNNDAFTLVNDFFCDVKEYLHKNANEPKFDPLFIPLTKKNELLNNPPSASDQFKNDVNTFTPWLFGNHTDPVRQKRVDIVKRLLLTLKLNANALQLENADATDKKEKLGTVNAQLPQDEQVPLVSLISHGGRGMIQLPPSSNPNQFIDWLFGGEAPSLAHDNVTATEEGKAVYARVAATHGAKYDEERGQYVEFKGAAVKDIAKGVLIEPRHMGLDVGLAGPNRAAPKDTGSFGHLYMYYIPPTETTAGVFMFGLEGSAPSGTRDTLKRLAKKATDLVSEKISSAETILSRAGEGHGTSGVSSDISPTDGRKWRDINLSVPFQPAATNGLNVPITLDALYDLTTHKADELTPADISAPAGIPSATLTATVTTPDFDLTAATAMTNNELTIWLLKKIDSAISLAKKRGDGKFLKNFQDLRKDIAQDSNGAAKFLKTMNEIDAQVKLGSIEQYPLSDKKIGDLKKCVASKDNPMQPIIANILLEADTASEVKLFWGLKKHLETKQYKKKTEILLNEVNRVGTDKAIDDIGKMLLTQYASLDKEINLNTLTALNRSRLFQDTARLAADYESQTQANYGTDRIAYNGKIINANAYQACLEINKLLPLMKTICYQELINNRPKTPEEAVMQAISFAKMIARFCQPMYDYLLSQSPQQLGEYAPSSMPANFMKEISQGLLGMLTLYSDQPISPAEKKMMPVYAQFFSLLGDHETMDKLLRDNDLDTLRELKTRIAVVGGMGTAGSAFQSSGFANAVDNLLANPMLIQAQTSKTPTVPQPSAPAVTTTVTTPSPPAWGSTASSNTQPPTSSAPTTTSTTLMPPSRPSQRPPGFFPTTIPSQSNQQDISLIKAIVNHDSWKGKYKGKNILKSLPPIIEELRDVVNNNKMDDQQKLKEIDTIMKDGKKTNDSHNQNQDVQDLITAYKSLTLNDFAKRISPQQPRKS